MGEILKGQGVKRNLGRNSRNILGAEGGRG